MKKLLFISLIGISSALFADDLDTLNSKLHELSPERLEFNLRLGMAYGPVFYHDCRLEDGVDASGKPVKVMDPSDAMVSPYFDGDKDFSNNPINIFKTRADDAGNICSAFPLTSELPSSVISTKTHFYLFYVTYHAFDGNRLAGHGQDSETIIYVIRKNEKNGLGDLEFVITNVHGFGKAYADNKKEEDRLQARATALLDATESRIAMFAFIPDQFALAHQSGQTQFLRGADGSLRGLEIFITQGGHAPYKFSKAAWDKNNGEGYKYVCVESGKQGEVQCYPIQADPKKREVGYSVYSLDEDLIRLYPDKMALTQLSEDQVKALKAERKKKYSGRARAREVETSQGWMRVRQDIPADIIKGPQDKEAEANLHYPWAMKGDFAWAFPHLVHRYLQPDRPAAEISDEYIFNPYIEYFDKEKADKEKAEKKAAAAEKKAAEQKSPK